MIFISPIFSPSALLNEIPDFVWRRLNLECLKCLFFSYHILVVFEKDLDHPRFLC